jgi:hypothetical protein
MNQRKIITAILFLTLAMLACGFNSGTAAPASQPIPTSIMPVVEATNGPAGTQVAVLPAPAITETRRLTLEYPSKMKAGVESELLILTLEVDDFGNITPTAQFQGNVVTGDVIEIPNLYETHNVTAEARLDLAGVDVSPSGSTFEPLLPGKSATFYWSIRPQDAGTYRGTAWLHLNFENKSMGEKSRIAVSAQVVEIEAVDFFGLSVNVARTSGVLGSIVGGVVGFPFLEDIVKYIFKRRKRNS